MESGLGLGQFELHSKSFGLHLQLRSSAFFDLPTNDAEVHRFHELMKEELTRSAGPRDWVFRGQSIELKINLNLGEATGPHEEEMISAAFSDCLMDGKFWAQTQMQPVSLKISSCPENHPQILVSLSGLVDHPGRKLHKLNEDVPIGDVRPPSGIKTIVLKGVRLEMYMSRSVHSRQTKDSASSDVCLRKPLAEISANSRPLKYRERYGAKCVAHAAKAELQVEASERLEERFRDTQSPAVPIIDSYWPSDDDDMLSIHSGQVPDRAKETSATPLGPEACTDAPVPHVGDSEIDGVHMPRRNVCLDLLDAALRHAIVPNPKLVRRGIRVSKGASFKPLAILSPALWSPGHLAAISARNVFLPTLSRVITGVGGISARGESLQDKLSKISGEALGPGLDNIEDHVSRHRITKTSVMQDIISVRLWNAMNSQLRQQINSKRLRPPSRNPLETSAPKIDLKALNFEQPSNAAHGSSWDYDIQEATCRGEADFSLDNSASESTDSMLDDYSTSHVRPLCTREADERSNTCQIAGLEDENMDRGFLNLAAGDLSWGDDIPEEFRMASESENVMQPDETSVKDSCATKFEDGWLYYEGSALPP